MFYSRNLLSGKRKYLWDWILLLLFISVICVAFSTTGSDDFDIARGEVLLRRIGDEIIIHCSIILYALFRQMATRDV